MPRKPPKTIAHTPDWIRTLQQRAPMLCYVATLILAVAATTPLYEWEQAYLEDLADEIRKKLDDML